MNKMKTWYKVLPPVAGNLHPVIVAISPHDTRAAGLAAFRETFPVAYRPIAVGTALHIR